MVLIKHFHGKAHTHVNQGACGHGRVSSSSVGFCMEISVVQLMYLQKLHLWEYEGVISVLIRYIGYKMFYHLKLCIVQIDLRKADIFVIPLAPRILHFHRKIVWLLCSIYHSHSCFNVSSSLNREWFSRPSMEKPCMTPNPLIVPMNVYFCIHMGLDYFIDCSDFFRK